MHRGLLGCALCSLGERSPALKQGRASCCNTVVNSVPGYAALRAWCEALRDGFVGTSPAGAMLLYSDATLCSKDRNGLTHSIFQDHGRLLANQEVLAFQSGSAVIRLKNSSLGQTSSLVRSRLRLRCVDDFGGANTLANLPYQ